MCFLAKLGLVFALEYARRLGNRRIFVATAQAFDGEMRDRIARHRDERGQDFTTVEEPLELGRVLRESGDVDVVLVDCLTLWLSNLLLRDSTVDDVEREVENVVTELKQRRCHVVLVSNEVGLGIVPETTLGRIFRDIVGRVHQRLASEADEVYFAAMGTVLRLVPSPVVGFRPGEMPTGTP
jgi:adenosylcobinamide kinase/adenosylcobinamide-phosphate guanylyltransferase